MGKEPSSSKPPRASSASHQQAVGHAIQGSESRKNEEYVRIREQHEFAKTAMNGKLVLAPMRSTGPLRILDSATGDGTWLFDLATQYPSATLIGTDINPKHFAHLPNRPSHLSFAKQSVVDNWPDTYQRSFDLVHQRYCLAMLGPDAGARAVSRLFGLVKKGAFIQLVEGEPAKFDAGPGHEAFARFNAFQDKALNGHGMNPRPAERLAQWLRDAGAVDVQERHFDYKLGAAAPAGATRAKTSANILSMLDNMASIASNLPDFFFKPADFQRLRAEMVKELATNGNRFKFRVVWGRRAA